MILSQSPNVQSGALATNAGKKGFSYGERELRDGGEGSDSNSRSQAVATGDCVHFGARASSFIECPESGTHDNTAGLETPKFLQTTKGPLLPKQSHSCMLR